MTILTNAFSQYDAKGIREDLQNTIYDISPTETPLMSAIGRGRATQKLHEWQTDQLASASTTNAQLEGDEETAVAVTATTRLANYMQISRKVFTITGSEEAAVKAGRKSEIAYQLAKKGKELKRDMEKTICSQQVAVAGGTATARKTACLDSWLTTNTSNGASGTDYTYTTTPTAARTDGTDRAFTEDILKTVIAATWESGGEADMLLVTKGNKQAMSQFPGIADIRVSANGKSQATIVGAADVYVSDFGDIKVVPTRFSETSLAYLVDPEYLKLAYFRPMMSEQLAKTGDGEKHVIRCEWGLVVTNEAAHGVARDLS